MKRKENSKMATEKYRHFFEIHAREKEDDKEASFVTIEGKAVTFNEETLLYKYGDTEVYEQIDSNAFEKADMRDVVFDLNHDWDRSVPLARTRNKSLTLEKKDDGLYFSARIDKDNEDGMKVYRAIQSGLLDKCSFAFTMSQDGQEITEKRGGENEADSIHIVVKSIDRLYDVSAVTIPAYDNTSLGARSANDRFAKDVETFKASVETEKINAKRKKLLSKTF